VRVLVTMVSGGGRGLGRGLWRYTRDPNYFGDAVVWFGLWLLACSHWLGLVLVASPVYMTNMLVRHTGKRLLEKHKARSKGAAYAEYVRRTSGFIPRRRAEKMGWWPTNRI
jgi:steroid 5-alpha reductase family enzyme